MLFLHKTDLEQNHSSDYLGFYYMLNIVSLTFNMFLYTNICISCKNIQYKKLDMK